MAEFIVFEGLDGSGKTTVAKKYVESLNDLGIQSTYVKIPNYENDSGKVIKGMLTGVIEFNPSLFTELVIKNTVEESKHIKNCLDNDIWVIADRYIFSDCIYRPIRERNLATKQSIIEILKEVNYNVDLVAPSVLVIVKAPIELALEGVSSRSENTEYFETKERYKEAVINFQVLEENIESICKQEFNSELKLISLNNFVVKHVRPPLVTLIEKLLEEI